ncbi:MAG TPA: maleylpyruvate isomerase family mycothiol-dependent enzyme [Streptosporangiaceae bacterium]|nr:maleylpyruvate isomerase family mycothiol-dependent enzyme [Streptosporangiaceae bacterium]
MTATINRTRSWMDVSTALFIAAADQLTDAELAMSTRLPGWTRRHVLAHVGLNATALGRLVHWASTGQPTPMYTSTDQRARDIAETAAWPAGRLRALVTQTAAELAAGLDRLPLSRWAAEVVTAQGRSVPASEIPWMRAREAAVHAVDLAAGTDFEDLPDDLCAALVTDVVRLRSRRGQDQALRLRSGDRSWLVAGTGQPARIDAPPGALARWLTGRGSAGLTVTGGKLPLLSPWL